MQFRLIHFREFDNSRTIRRFPLPGLHAWAVAEEDIGLFLMDYRDGNPVVVTPAANEQVWALDYQAVDRWVMADSHVFPTPVPFVPEEHVVDYVYDEFDFRIWRNPFQVLIVPRGADLTAPLATKKGTKRLRRRATRPELRSARRRERRRAIAALKAHKRRLWESPCVKTYEAPEPASYMACAYPFVYTDGYEYRYYSAEPIPPAGWVAVTR